MTTRPRRKFSESVYDFGVEVGKLSNPLHLLGLMSAEAAANGFATSDDAGEILQAFWSGRRAGKGEARMAEPPSNVQVSKLRKFIELGEQLGSDGVENIRLLPEMCIEMGEIGDLYNLSVKVARDALAKRKPLTEGELRNLIKSEREK